MAEIISPVCPICKKPEAHQFRPFCSARCANIDLGGWLSEKYTVPAADEPEESDIPQEDSE